MKKFLKILCVLMMFLITPVIFVGCDKDNDIQIRVQDGYVQWSDGDGWENLISVEDLKGEQGIQGIQGVAGKKVQFQTTETHIQWRYEGETDWNNLVAFEDLQEKEEDVDTEAIYQRGFELFQTTLINHRGAVCRITYDYWNMRLVDSFCTFVVGGTELTLNAEFTSSKKSFTIDGNGEAFRDQTLLVVPEAGKLDGINWYEPNNIMVATYKPNLYLSNIYEFYSTSGGYDPNLVNYTDYEFSYKKFLKQFEIEDIYSCQINEAGDCKISFNYAELGVDYIYEYCVKSDGEIQSCNIYEKDFLTNEKGDIYCKVTYENLKTDITMDMLEEVLEKEKENNPNITDFASFFRYSIKE